MRHLWNRRLAVLLLFCCGLLLLAALQAQAALKPGTFYVVGTGPAGPEHATLRALEVMQQADFILTDAKTAARFAQYLQGKTILADPWEGMWDYKGKPWREIPSLGKEEVKAFKAARIKRRDDLVAQIKAKLAQGQTVALLDNGDPCLFGPSHWYIEGFDPQQVEIIPGVGAFSAAMAALKKSSLPAYDTRFVLQTSPFFFWGKQRQEDLARELAKYPTTMVFFMGLEEMQPLVAMLQKHYPADLPIAVVYHAGFPDREKVVKGTLPTSCPRLRRKRNSGWG
jgi:precorrin-4 methylase